MITKFFLWLTRFSALRRSLWKFFYNLLATLLPEKNWQLMNYGYVHHLHEESPELSLPPDYELQRFSLQMYHHLALLGPITGKKVLEVGCGRGGGGNYLYHQFNPASYTGVDFARQAIQICRKRYPGENLHFEVGQAEQLPFGDAEFDIVINLESSRYYPNFKGFLAEVKRVLKPGGKLLLADYRLMPEMEDFKEGLRQCGMSILSEEDITENVIASLDRQTDQYLPEIRKRVPLYFRGIFTKFAAVRGTPVYQSFRNGERQYFRLVLEKTK
jgi:ubiquinone/menaquinone biosynthesis C-methylase UbiE